MVFRLVAPMALPAASKAFRGSTDCAEAVPANKMSSPRRKHSFRAIRIPHSRKIRLEIKDLDFWIRIQDWHPYTPEALLAAANCTSSEIFKKVRGEVGATTTLSDVVFSGVACWIKTNSVRRREYQYGLAGVQTVSARPQSEGAVRTPSRAARMASIYMWAIPTAAACISRFRASAFRPSWRSRAA